MAQTLMANGREVELGKVKGKRQLGYLVGKSALAAAFGSKTVSLKTLSGYLCAQSVPDKSSPGRLRRQLLAVTIFNIS